MECLGIGQGLLRNKYNGIVAGSALGNELTGFPGSIQKILAPSVLLGEDETNTERAQDDFVDVGIGR